MSKKIVIIGAGPVGCFTAQLLKLHGFNPLVIEEHRQIGRPIHCTGLVGSKVFTNNNPVNAPKSSIINIINGAVIHYDGQYFTIERKNVAYVIDRERFDKELGNGLDILYHKKFTGLKKTGNGYTVEMDKNNLFADIVIGANGANSSIRRILNPNTNIKCHKGVQLRIKTKVRHKDLVEVYLKKPSFYWVVPEGKDVVRVGTISENPIKDLKYFLNEIKMKGEVLEQYGGLVAIGICDVTAKGNMAVVGDAACQVKPLSYGGVYFGLEAASILASCIKDNRLMDYDSLWKTKLASEIRIGLKVRNIYNHLYPDDIRNIFILMKKQKSLIEKIGDFENHGRLILKMFKKPDLYHLISKFIGRLVVSLFES